MLHAPLTDRKNKAESINSGALAEHDQQNQQVNLSGQCSSTRDRSNLATMQQAYGNQGALRMLRAEKGQSQGNLFMTSFPSNQDRLLQRKYDRSNMASSSGSCNGCQNNSAMALTQGEENTALSAPVTPETLIDEANSLRISYLSRARIRVRQLEIACEKQADSQLLIQALPNEVRPFVSWLGALPGDDNFCVMVALAKSDIEKNLSMTLPTPFFAGQEDEFCKLNNSFPLANYEDNQIRICPKLVNPESSNLNLRALVLIHEMFHEPSFGMGHPTLDVMNSSHCGFSGSDEAVSNPYCVTNVIGQLGGGDQATM